MNIENTLPIVNLCSYFFLRFKDIFFPKTFAHEYSSRVDLMKEGSNYVDSTITSPICLF